MFDVQLKAGPLSAVWDGRSDAGTRVPDGVYFVTVRTGAGSEVVRAVRLK
jgi:flagellar hook assembly protein FlgD